MEGVLMETRMLLIKNYKVELCGLAQQDLLHEPHLFIPNKGHSCALCLGVAGVFHFKNGLFVELAINYIEHEDPRMLLVEYRAKIIPHYDSIEQHLRKIGCRVERYGQTVTVTNIPYVAGHEDLCNAAEVNVHERLLYNKFHQYITDYYGDFGCRAFVIDALRKAGYENPGGLLGNGD
jgi:hypothetical protein